MGGLVMKKNNLKRPIINKFIIGTLSAGLLAGGAAPETDAIFVREVYAADSTEGAEVETPAEPSVPAEPTAVPEPTAEPEPTQIPEPTAVPEPTAAPEPTATPEPTDRKSVV